MSKQLNPHNESGKPDELATGLCNKWLEGISKYFVV